MSVQGDCRPAGGVACYCEPLDGGGLWFSVAKPWAGHDELVLLFAVDGVLVCVAPLAPAAGGVVNLRVPGGRLVKSEAASEGHIGCFCLRLVWFVEQARMMRRGGCGLGVSPAVVSRQTAVG